MHGQGKLTTAEGECYDGEFAFGLKEGRGKQVFRDGAVYEGSWLDGEPHAMGVLRTADGEVYTGFFEQGLRSGSGSLMHADGSTYVGVFEEDLPQGNGQLMYADGTTTCSGDFCCGKKHGEGVFVTPKWKFEGSFADDHIHGKGCVTLPNGETCEGLWTAAPDGSGLTTIASDSVFVKAPMMKNEAPKRVRGRKRAMVAAVLGRRKQQIKAALRMVHQHIDKRIPASIKKRLPPCRQQKPATIVHCGRVLTTRKRFSFL